MKNAEEKRPFAQADGAAQGQDAFAELFERYKNLVYKTAFLMLGSAEEAEEALQEVFVLVYRSQADYDPQRGAWTTWLHRITINYCLGSRRKRRVICQPIEGELAASAESGEPELARVADRELVRQAINRLSDKLRAVVILKYYWGLPYAGIAEILQVPPGTVKSRSDLALRTLRRMLAGTGDEALQTWGQSPAPEGEVRP